MSIALAEGLPASLEVCLNTSKIRLEGRRSKLAEQILANECFPVATTIGIDTIMMSTGIVGNVMAPHLLISCDRETAGVTALECNCADLAGSGGVHII